MRNKVQSCKPAHGGGHNTLNHMFHAPEDVNQRTRLLRKKFLHM